MRRITRSSLVKVGALGTLALVILSACGGDDDAPLFPEEASQTTAAATDTTAAASTAPLGNPDAGAIVTTVENPLGQILADRDGRTLYVFDNDTEPNKATCVDQCATNWPPVTAAGAPISAGSVDGSQLSTTPRADGKLQVTYFGRPLYYFKSDTKPGDTLGQNVGGLWHVVGADGQPVAGGAGAAPGTINATANPLGTIVTGAEGRTLYLILDDLGKPEPTCNDTCATNWPPVIESGPATAGAGLDASRLGAIGRADGQVQLTYNGWPLYTFSGDAAAGDTKGQGVGQKWFVLDTQGNPIGAPAGAAAPPAAATTAAPAAPATIAPAETDLGTVLADADGLTLYAFETEKPNLPTPACYDSCADTWPPLLIDGDPVAGNGLDPALLGTVERDDGSIQVTYNKWPLYYFAADRQAGDTNGQGVGQVWFVLGPDGKLIK
jgi:predicted lipoprotein with Yx(FWY)xxD motif